MTLVKTIKDVKSQVKEEVKYEEKTYRPTIGQVSSHDRTKLS